MRTAAIVMFLGVALGAFGAHGIKNHYPSELLPTWQTGVQYHLLHALALLALAQQERLDLRWPRALMLTGILLFSGNCYLYVLSGAKIFGMLVPLGGTCFLAAWGLLAFKAGSSKK